MRTTVSGIWQAPWKHQFLSLFFNKKGLLLSWVSQRHPEVDRLGTITPILQIRKQKFRQINKGHNLRSESQDPEDLGIRPDSSECRCSVLIRLNDKNTLSAPLTVDMVVF